jgi:hypothetical protein
MKVMITIETIITREKKQVTVQGVILYHKMTAYIFTLICVIGNLYYIGWHGEDGVVLLRSIW